MVIDFHTHTFPDKIAPQTIAALAEKSGSTPYRNGTLSSLLESMRKNGVDYSVILPVATKPSQVPSINRLAAQLNGKDGIIYAGCIHPLCENVEAVLDDIRQSGLFGLKIHPDYQNTCLDDPVFLRILREAAKRDLVVVTHAGIDIGYPETVHCTPDMVLHVLDELSGLVDDKLVLAHMGGCDLPEEVLEKLCGKPVYFDTAYVLDRYPEKCLRIIRAHGADHILFATDSPWADQGKYVELLQSFDLPQADKDKIFFENALRLTNK